MKKIKLGIILVITMAIAYFLISYGLFFADKESIDLELQNAEISDVFQDSESFDSSCNIVPEITNNDLFHENIINVDTLADQYINDDIDEILINFNEEFLDIDEYDDNNIQSLPIPPTEIDQPKLIDEEQNHLAL